MALTPCATFAESRVHQELQRIYPAMTKASLAIIIVIIVAAAFGAVIWRSGATPPHTHQDMMYLTGSYKGSEWLQNHNGYQQALRLSEEHQAPILIYVYTDWCTNCKKFVDELLPQPSVKDALNGFIKLKLNPEDGPKEEALSEDWGVRGYPNLFVQSGRSSPPVIIRAPFVRLTDGWQLMDAEQFIAVLAKHGLRQ